MKSCSGNIILLIRIALCNFIFLMLTGWNSNAQCPPNIDFESGNFSGWQCYTGLIDPGNIMLTPCAPMKNRHEIYYRKDVTENDYWGGFPKVCPNGSMYSIRLGNDSTGRGAERVSYTFTVPANQQTFNLVYNYAVVLQDPGHLPSQQPRLNIEVLNVTDNVVDACSSFDFVATASLPGFKYSQQPSNSPVLYKDWSAAFINLSGKAGKQFKISFTATDCSEAAHFGYAYIDVNTISGCDNTVPGSVFCPDDSFAILKGPPGFQSYKWINTSNIVLGTEQNLLIRPAPHAGDTMYIQLTPYSGYGCPDTLAIYLNDTLTVMADAGPDQKFCVSPPIQLGSKPKGWEVYKWSPAQGLSDPDIANPLVSPVASIQYILTANNYAGGCRSTDTVKLTKKCEVIEIYVPNAFTPDGNGKNDRLKPVLYGYSKLNYFRVYNRYGQLLFASKDGNAEWDGTFKGRPLSTQTVVWVVEAINANGITDLKQGTTILLR